MATLQKVWQLWWSVTVQAGDFTIGGSLKVDTEILRMFADYLENASVALASLNVLGPFAEVEGALPGTGFQETVAAASGATATAVLGASGRMTAVAGVASGVAGTYDTTEDDFVAKLKSMDMGG